MGERIKTYKGKELQEWIRKEELSWENFKRDNSPPQKNNIQLEPQFVVFDNSKLQRFLLDTNYQIMYGMDLFDSNGRDLTIGQEFLKDAMKMRYLFSRTLCCFWFGGFYIFLNFLAFLKSKCFIAESKQRSVDWVPAFWLQHLVFRHRPGPDTSSMIRIWMPDHADLCSCGQCAKGQPWEAGEADCHPAQALQPDRHSQRRSTPHPSLILKS